MESQYASMLNNPLLILIDQYAVPLQDSLIQINKQYRTLKLRRRAITSKHTMTQRLHVAE